MDGPREEFSAPYLKQQSDKKWSPRRHPSGEDDAHEERERRSHRHAKHLETFLAFLAAASDEPVGP